MPNTRSRKVPADVRAEFNAAIRAETTHRAPDARRVIRDERILLQSCMQSGDVEAMRAQAAECRRVRIMWERVL